MGVLNTEVGNIPEVQAQVTSQIGAEAPAGAFWDQPVGKAALEFGPGTGAMSVATGIILAPTPSVWSMFQWRFEAVESGPAQQLAARVYSGFMVFSDIAGTPDVRFGTGSADPGFAGNWNASQARSFNYNRQVQTNMQMLFDNTASRPLSIDSLGEITAWMQGNIANCYAKGTLIIGPEVVLPNAP